MKQAIRLEKGQLNIARKTAAKLPMPKNLQTVGLDRYFVTEKGVGEYGLASGGAGSCFLSLFRPVLLMFHFSNHSSK